MGADKYAASLDIDATTALTLVRRPHNGRDGNAISVNVSSSATSTDTDSIICGYLPAHFTSALAPLIDAQYVTATATAVTNSADDDDELSGDVDESVALPSRRDVRLCVRVFAAAVCVSALDVCETHRISHYVSAMQTYAQYAQVPYGIRMLKQFKLVVDSAAKYNAHLFTAQELADLSVFQRLDDDAQNLFVRLCWRRQRQAASASRWFAVALLCTRYKHIRDVRKAANTLIQSHRSADDSENTKKSAGLLESSLSTSLAFDQVFEQIIDAQTVAALRLICVALRVVVKSGLNRAEIIGLMRRSICQQRTLRGVPLSHDLRTQNIFHSVAGEFVRLSPPFFNSVQRMYRLFFLSPDVSDSSIAVAATPMLLESLGRQKFAQTIVRGKREETMRRLFPSRAAFLAYDNALRLLEAIRIATDDYDGVVYGKLDTPLAMLYLQQARQRLARELTDPHTTADEPIHSVSVIPTVTFSSDYQCYFTTFHPALIPPSRPDELAFIDHFRAASVYANACYYGVKSLEKNHRYAEAATIMFELLSQRHATQRRGFWWNRLSILFATHFKDKERALWICRLALDDEFVRTGDRIEVERRCLRLWKDKAGGNRTGICPVNSVLPLPTSLKRTASKRRRSIPIEAEDAEDIDDADVMIDETRTHVVSINRLTKSARTSSSSPLMSSSSNISTITIRGRPLNREIGVKSHFIGYDNAQCSVEQLALQYYAMEANGGWSGMHCEKLAAHDVVRYCLMARHLRGHSRSLSVRIPRLSVGSLYRQLLSFSAATYRR